MVSSEYSGLERVLGLPKLNQKQINPEYLAETDSLDSATEQLFNVEQGISTASFTMIR